MAMLCQSKLTDPELRAPGSKRREAAVCKEFIITGIHAQMIRMPEKIESRFALSREAVSS